MMLRILIALLLAAVLCACGTTGNANLSAPLPDKISFEFEDQRQPQTMASSKVAGPGGEITVLGDDSITPKPDQLVKSVLQAEAGRQLAGKRVVLSNFHLEVRDPGGRVDDARLAAAAGSQGTGALGALLARPIIGVIEDSRVQKVVVLDVTISVNGQRIWEDHRNVYRGRVTERNINETILEGLRKVAARAAQQ